MRAKLDDDLTLSSLCDMVHSVERCKILVDSPQSRYMRTEGPPRPQTVSTSSHSPTYDIERQQYLLIFYILFFEFYPVCLINFLNFR